MKIGLSARTILRCAVIVAFFATTVQASAATVETDKEVYGAGEVARITGLGWSPGEVVQLDVAQLPELSPADTLYAIAGEAGNIDSGYVVPGNGVTQAFTLTASGQTSQSTSQATFTNGQDPAAITLSPIATIPLTTNKDHYAPGETVLISGSGWTPRETVSLELAEDPPVHPAHVLSAIADDGGRIFAGYFVTNDDLERMFTLTALGRSSGRTARIIFADDPRPDCQSDAECDDNNPCTHDYCHTDHKCHNDNRNNGDSCSDGNLCNGEEICGNGGTCRAGTNVAAGTACGDSDNSACNAPDTCDGSGTCVDHKKAAGTVCAAGSGVCDPDDTCDGASNTCVQKFANEGTSCGDSDNTACNAPDTCSGSGSCVDNKKPRGTVCLAGTGTCDPDDTCDGASNTCAQKFANEGTSCGDSDNTACNAPDTCSGSGSCVDRKKPNGAVCLAGTGTCDPDDTCDGVSNGCAQKFADEGTACGDSSSSDCDDPDSCDTSGSCQANHKAAGTPCTPDSHECTNDVCGEAGTCTHDQLAACSLFTDSSLCTFDVDGGSDGSQFRLLLTPDPSNPPAYKLNASNPGQFYYNVVYLGTGNATVNLILPYPFITQGAVPIHVYCGVDLVANDTCFTPGTEIGHSSQPVTLASYGAQQFGSKTTVPVSVPDLSTSCPSGVAYINVHLDYGLKGNTNYAKGGTGNDAINTSTPPSIPDKQPYVFSDGVTPADSVQSENVFKKNPGFGGFVQVNGSSDPVAGALVEIWDSSNKKVAGVATDQDGWYVWQYKYTGKAATFTVKLPKYKLQQAVTLKSNGFLVVNFTTPY